MKLLLKRTVLTPKFTQGELYIDEKYFCDTLEDTNRDSNKNGKFDNGEVKVFGETCIPYGSYQIEMIISPKFSPRYGGRKVPHIKNVNSFENVLIHSGNTVKDTEGCILVGQKSGEGIISNSKNTLFKLLDILDKNSANLSIDIK